MFIQKLTIDVYGDVDKDKLADEFSYLLSCYRKSGQSQTDGELPFIGDSFLSCFIPTLEKDSLSTGYNDEWAGKQLEKVESLSGNKLRIEKVGKTSLEFDPVCTCSKPNCLILFTHLLNRLSPILCGTCFKTVPLYRLGFSCDLRHSILTWEANYIACDRLQMNCTVGERWATRQMSAVSSALSKEGLEVCRNIYRETGCKTYYYLYNYRRVSTARDQKRLCPSCGGQWLLTDQLDNFFNFKCDNCMLISSITSNSLPDKKA